jgi:Pyridoxamine 5'-phosphate oxidase
MAPLAAVAVAMLGTVRPDGSPRISPVEPYLAGGQLLIGAMAWSRKAADLHRDPRYVLHSVVTGPDTGEGELKLHGSAAPAGPQLRAAATGAWWSGRPEQAAGFVLGIATALFIEWDLEHGVMAAHQWNPRDGYHHRTRRYQQSAPAAPPRRPAAVAWLRAGLACPHRAWRRAVAQPSPRPATRRNAPPGPNPAALAPAAAVLARGSPGRGLRLAGEASPMGRLPADEPGPWALQWASPPWVGRWKLATWQLWPATGEVTCASSPAWEVT